MPETRQERTQHLREHAERNLGALVITIEFTMISVVVGVILFPFMDNAAAVLRDLRFEYWPYIVSGLCFTLLLWTQVISHSLSFVGWPIDIGHNLLYIVFGLVLGIQMHFIADPRAWFAISLLTTIVAWALIYYDAHVIRERLSGSSGAARGLFDTALVRQEKLARFFVVAFVDAVINLALIVFWPQLIIDQSGHLVLIIVQAVFTMLLTVNTIQVFNSWREPVVLKAMEELSMEGED